MKSATGQVRGVTQGTSPWGERGQRKMHVTSSIFNTIISREIWFTNLVFFFFLMFPKIHQYFWLAGAGIDSSPAGEAEPCPTLPSKQQQTQPKLLRGQISGLTLNSALLAARQLLLLDSWQFRGGWGSENCTFSAGEGRSVLFFANQRLSVKVKLSRNWEVLPFNRGKVQLITFRRQPARWEIRKLVLQWGLQHGTSPVFPALEGPGRDIQNLSSCCLPHLCHGWLAC